MKNNKYQTLLKPFNYTFKKFTMKKILFIAAFGFLSQVLFSQSINSEKLDSYFDVLGKNNKFMGTVAINKNGKEIYQKSIGFADVQNNLKANSNTKYRIGSVSKTFTATLIFKAIEENKLSLEDNIIKFFPSIKNADKITIGQLLSHRSGIGNFTSDDTFTQWRTSPRTKKEMLDIIKAAGSNFSPDSTAQYSNSNYVLLTYILEDVYKQPFDKILNKKIIKKGGLKNTHNGKKINPAKNEANSYIFRENWIKDAETEASISLGAGAIVSTAKDVNTFIEALFRGEVISLENLELMKPKGGNIGMGLLLPPYNNKSGFGHNGSIDAFTSFFAHFPKDNVTYSITSNGSNMNMNSINETIIKAINNEAFEIPVFNTINIATESLDQYLGTYVNENAPFNLIITRIGNTLQVQPTNQPVFDLTVKELHTYVYEKRNVVIQFNPEKNTLNFQMGERNMDFTRE